MQNFGFPFNVGLSLRLLHTLFTEILPSFVDSIEHSSPWVKKNMIAEFVLVRSISETETSKKLLFLFSSL